MNHVPDQILKMASVFIFYYITDYKNCNEQTYSCPRDWRLSASWDLT